MHRKNNIFYKNRGAINYFFLIFYTRIGWSGVKKHADNADEMDKRRLIRPASPSTLSKI